MKTLILLDWKELPGSTIGLAQSMRWGHKESRITLDSSARWTRSPYLVIVVAMHEIGHIVLSYNHTYDDPTALMQPTTYWMVMRLNWDEQAEMLRIYHRVRPGPQTPTGAYRP